jgi:tetratricopeptide (TPR) repeat protein
MAGLARPGSGKNGPVQPSNWHAPAALLLLTLAAYANSFGLGLAQDSKVIVSHDTRLREVNAENLKLILEKNYWWPTTGDGLYRPVTTLSLLFNYAVLGNGLNGSGYHAVNFLLHAVNVWLAYELALLLLGRGRPAFFAAALWAVHPIGTEAVTGVVGRADLLAAMAVLGGLLLYIRSRSRWTPAALFAIAGMGVFAKENAAILLGLMLLWDFCFAEGKSTVMRRWPCYAAVAASLLLLWGARHAVLGALPPNQMVYVDNPLRSADFWTARWTAVKVIGLDLWLLLWPVGLSCDRSFDQIPLAGWGDPWARLSLLVVLAVLGAAVARYRKDRLVFWLAGFFGIALLPTANLLFPIGATMAERFLYLPSVAFATAIAALVFRLKSRHVTTALAALLLLYAVRTMARNPAWNDDLSLASADIPSAPRSFRLHTMLATELFAKDGKVNIDRVIREQEEAWRILAPLPPERSSSYAPTDLGIYYAAKADLVSPAEQQAWNTRSLEMLLRARTISRALEKAYDDRQRAYGRPPTVRAAPLRLYLHLAAAYVSLGDFQNAVEALRYGRGLDPRALETYDGLSIAYHALGNLPMMAATLEAKAQVDGFQPETLAAIREVYQHMPDASCALVQQGAGWQFNLACPRVRTDLCQSAAELVEAFSDARQPEQAAGFRKDASQRWGCALEP